MCQVIVPPIPGPFTENMNCLRSTRKAHIHEIEKISFTPLIFSTTGGMANEATDFLQAPCLPAL